MHVIVLYKAHYKAIIETYPQIQFHHEKFGIYVLLLLLTLKVASPRNRSAHTQQKIRGEILRSSFGLFRNLRCRNFGEFSALPSLVKPQRTNQIEKETVSQCAII